MSARVSAASLCGHPGAESTGALSAHLSTGRLAWAPRPDPDVIPEPKCTCEPGVRAALAAQGRRNVESNLHSFLCACSVSEYKRREAHLATVAAWDKAERRRARAVKLMAELSTSKGWKADWRRMQREVAICPIDPLDKAITNPVSRYLLAMGERPCYIEVGVDKPGKGLTEGSKPGTHRTTEQHPQTQTLGGPCACQGCADWVKHYATRGTSTTGAWTCGCEINGLGSCRVGVDQRVTAELVIACARHRGTF